MDVGPFHGDAQGVLVGEQVRRGGPIVADHELLGQGGLVRRRIPQQMGQQPGPEAHEIPHPAAAVALLEDADGVVADRVELGPDGGARALELEENLFHCFVANGEGTAVLEVKRGPYVPTPESDFAPWAPPEGDAAALAFLERLRTAKPGDNVAPK